MHMLSSSLCQAPGPSFTSGACPKPAAPDAGKSLKFLGQNFGSRSLDENEYKPVCFYIFCFRAADRISILFQLGEKFTDRKSDIWTSRAASSQLTIFVLHVITFPL